MKAAKVMEQLFKRSNIYFLALIMVAFSPLANAKPINVNQKLPNDKREYRAIKLDNKLEALLISDVTLNKSAAALDVNAGSIRDPLDKQGLAHFLEHVLFLGTKTYPEPDEFITFVEQHRGKWNAFTAPESTNYHFDINHDGLEGALKRFSLFFIEPTFNKNFITKERNAVHSEFKKNLDNDSSRIYRVYQELIIKDHPARGFAVGNNETLAKVGGKELLDFYKKYYSANIMKLVIMSNKSLDDQEKLVKQYFSPIKNYNVKLDKIPTKIIDNKNLPSEIRVQTLKDTKELELSFPIPSMFPYWQTKPESILSHLLGHEGKGSLFSLLKKENLASAIVASTHSTSFAGSFDVDITMTDYGQKNIDKIVSHFFSYIEMLNKNGYKKYIYDEESTMRSINFVYRDHQEGVWVASKFANLMQKYPPLEIEKAQALLQEYGPQDFSMLLSHIKPANMILFEQGKDVKTDKTEHFFKTKYAINKIPSKRIKKWEAAKLNKTLSYPQQNPFIPKDLALYKTQDTKPKNIINAKWGEFWFQGDNKFHLPKASVELRLLTDKVNTSPSSKMLANLYSLALNRSLEEWKYPITLAGLSFNIQRIDRGISLQFSGYSENIPFLIESISKKLLLLDVDQKTFEDIKSELKRMVINSYKAPAYQQAIYHLRYLADSKMIHPKYYFQPSGLPGSIDLISDVTLKQVRENAKKVLSRFAIEGAAYGNLKEQEVKTALLSLPKNLKASPLPAELRGRSLALKLDQGESFAAKIKSSVNNNSWVSNIQFGERSPKLHAILAVAQGVLKASFFKELRTKQQLGYVVTNWIDESDNLLGMNFVIQSDQYPPNELSDRAATWMHESLNVLKNVSNTELKRLKDAVAIQFRREIKTIPDQLERIVFEAITLKGQFGYNEAVAKEAEKLTKNDMIEAFKNAFNNKSKKSLSVYLSKKGIKDFKVKEKVIQDELKFKAHAKYY